MGDISHLHDEALLGAWQALNALDLLELRLGHACQGAVTSCGYHDERG